jgi:hypothetical protein
LSSSPLKSIVSKVHFYVTLSAAKGPGPAGFIRATAIPTLRFFVVLPEEGLLRMTFNTKPFLRRSKGEGEDIERGAFAPLKYSYQSS